VSGKKGIGKQGSVQLRFWSKLVIWVYWRKLIYGF